MVHFCLYLHSVAIILYESISYKSVGDIILTKITHQVPHLRPPLVVQHGQYIGRTFDYKIPFGARFRPLLLRSTYSGVFH